MLCVVVKLHALKIHGLELFLGSQHEINKENEVLVCFYKTSDIGVALERNKQKNSPLSRAIDAPWKDSCLCF